MTGRQAEVAMLCKLVREILPDTMILERTWMVSSWGCLDRGLHFSVGLG